jgi:hypothetical protein
MRLIAFLLLAMTAAAQAQDTAIPAAVPATVKTAATGNLPPDFYPRSSCKKPDGKFLKRTPASRDIPAYNKKVQAYNQAAHIFNLCVTAYTAQAQRDMEVIREAVNAANGD